MADSYEKDTTILAEDGAILPATFHIWDIDPQDPDKMKISLFFSGRELTSSDQYSFFALQSIRKELEKEGLKLNCYGASKNVYPSPMSLNMGGGENVNRLYLGQRTRSEDIVWIFDTGSDVIPATVAEQEAFFEEWKNSVLRL